MNNPTEFQELWLYIETQIEVDGKLFYSGVTWSDYSVNTDSYVIHSDISGEVKDYTIPKENALETNRFIRATNISTSEWQYRERISPVTDYIKATKDYLGVVITSEPTFRDGENPHRISESSTD